MHIAAVRETSLATVLASTARIVLAKLGQKGFGSVTKTDIVTILLQTKNRRDNF